MNMQTVQILVAEPAQKKMKCERTFLYTPESVNAWLEIDVDPDLPSLRLTRTLERHKSCASTELDTDTELDVEIVSVKKATLLQDFKDQRMKEEEKKNEDQEQKRKEADELAERRAWCQLRFENDWRANHDKYISKDEWMAFVP